MHVHEGSNMVSIGELAEICCTTQRTLRHYQSKGLLEPAFVSPQTGYRYYTVDQARDLQTITLLKTLGLTLQEIHEMVARPSRPEKVAQRIGECLQDIQRRQEELALARHLGAELQRSCQIVDSPPPFDTVIIEELEHRTLRLFDIEQSDMEDGLSRVEKWGRLESRIKRQLLAEGTPALHRNIGGLVSQESLAKGSTEFDCAFISVTRETQEESARLLHLPAGTYACIYERHYNPCDADHKRGFQVMSSLMEKARALGYKPDGALLHESLASGCPVGYEGYDCLSRFCVPVRALGPSSKQTPHRRPSSEAPLPA